MADTIEKLEARGMKHPLAMIVAQAIADAPLSFPTNPGIITPAMLNDGAALSVLGRAANTSGVRADIAAASDGQVLRRSGTFIGFGAVDLGSANARTGQLPAANVVTGTSGAAIPLLNAANTWGALQTFSSGLSLGNETLSVYDEGTWTPTLRFGGATTGITYSTQLGRYTKIGRFVLAEFRIVLSSKGTATGDATIVTLPFTPAQRVGGSLAYFDNLVSGAGNIPQILTNGTEILVRRLSQAGGGNSSVPDTAFANNTGIEGAISFSV